MFARAKAACDSRGVTEPQLSSNLRGILFVTASAAAMAVMSAIVRHLAGYGTMHAFEIAFFRNLFGLLVFIPVLWRTGFGPLRTDKLGLLGIRSVCNALSMSFYFLGLSMMPLVEVTALNFTIPLFVTLGAVLFLKEQMGWRRWTALAVGFAGALIIIRPGVAIVDPGALIVIASAAIWAIAVIDIKILARTESSVTITFYGILFNALLCFVLAVFVWSWPTREELVWLLAVGIFGTLGHLLFAQALKLADASLLSTLDFTRLLWAALFGYVFFSEIPLVWTWVGGAVIFAAATYITWREARTDKPTVKPATAAETAPRPAE
jgi:drug/metabolite transporter (DMT)-like permease